MLKGHAVVGKKAADGEGEGGQHTQPSHVRIPYHGAEPKVNTYRHSDGKQCENELPQREAEEQALLIVADLFVDAYLYEICLLSSILFF